MSSRRAVRAGEAVGPTAIARGLLPVALHFGRGAGVTGSSKLAMCSRRRHCLYWPPGVCLDIDIHDIKHTSTVGCHKVEIMFRKKGMRSQTAYTYTTVLPDPSC